MALIKLCMMVKRAEGAPLPIYTPWQREATMSWLPRRKEEVLVSGQSMPVIRVTHNPDGVTVVILSAWVGAHDRLMDDGWREV